MVVSKRKANGSTPSTTTSSTSKSTKSGPPTPYVLLPAALRPFTPTLSPSHIYILHIDRHPAFHKRNLFIVPILLNIAILVGLAYRIYYILPWYWALILPLTGQKSPLSVDTATTPFGELVNETVSRTGVLLLDFLLLRVLAPWPYDFFISNRSPTAWRLEVGFQEEEVIVRRSRPSWDTNLPLEWLSEDSGAEIYKDRIMPAIDKEWIRKKTAYLMMDKNWDLDFGAMRDAHVLIKRGKCELNDFQKSVLVHTEEFGWIMWEVWRLDEQNTTPNSQGGEGGKMTEDEQQKRKDKIGEFREKLAKMGKEDLFFRWVEIVQYESTQPGGFTPERRQKAMLEVKKVFAKGGVDINEFFDSMGGMQGVSIDGDAK